jgi:hypothetical protein
MVAENAIELAQGVRDEAVCVPELDAEVFAGVGVVEFDPVEAGRRRAR